MADLKVVVLNKFNEILTSAEIEKQIEILQNSNYWYKYSYSPFVKRFNETRGTSGVDVWTERVALVYSWLPKIPRSSFATDLREIQEIINKLTEIERYFYNAELLSIERTAYQGEYQGETAFSSCNGYYDMGLRDFLIPAGKLLHDTVRLDTQLSSTTKLLHFMCPNLFPIFDTKVCKQIYGPSANQTYSKYHSYVFGLKEFLENSEIVFTLKHHAEKMNVSVLYIVDLVLFNYAEKFPFEKKESE
ncbi:hypothetical protein SAFG77S_11599 [Streptomyces afghaniensis]|uniref:hypothetical protein n=1 Tax=Bacillus sp. J37 TaxID=935837 RepID=UPI0004795F2D|nr:hypothetical protein [Bacillus sp. J37]HWK23360.1 hypothetical protein [Ureibacillus sp.]